MAAWASSTLSGNGTFTAIEVPGGWVLIDVYGTFGNGSVALTYRHPDGTMGAINDASDSQITISAVGGARVCLPKGHFVGGVLTGATNPSLTFAVTPIFERVTEG